MAAEHPSFLHMRLIVDSVLATESALALAGTTSMHDLIVVSRPISEPPYDVIAVRAPGSVHRPRNGHVIVEHLTVTGRNDSLERPVAEAVPLFWRFVIEKYGIHPV